MLTIIHAPGSSRVIAQDDATLAVLYDNSSSDPVEFEAMLSAALATLPVSAPEE